MNRLPLAYKDFKENEKLTLEDICRAIVLSNRDRIRIKKEELAVRNLFHIVRTVMTLSQKNGFHSMSLRDLSSETGLSMGALYNYFKSKDELLFMIFTQGQKSISEILMIYTNKTTSVFEKILISILVHLYLSEALQKLFYFFFMEAKSLPKKDQKKAIHLEQLTEHFFEEILLEGIDKGEFHLDNPLLTASAIKALLQDWYLKRYKYATRKVSVEDYAKFVIQFVFKNLK
jgi:AcrR family transcriptional regulator